MQKETIQNHFLQSCLKGSRAQQHQSNATLKSAPKKNPQNKSLSKKGVSSLEHFQSPKKNIHQNNKYFVQTPPTFQKHNIKNVQAQQQSRRNRMKDQNLLQIQIAFRLLDIQNDSQQKNRQNLAKIALELGQSEENILRHYRLFRRNMSSNFSRKQQVQQVQYDQLESSQRKTKLEKLITDFIRKKTYFSVGQFVYNVKQTTKTQYTKKQIQECFTKLIQKNALIFNKKQERTDDYVYDLFKTYKQNGNSLLFFSHYTYVTNQKQKFTVGLLCGEKGITYIAFPINGDEKRHTLEILLEMYFKQYRRVQKFVIITSFQDVYNSKSIINDDIHEKKLHEILQPWGSSLFILQQKKQYMNIAFLILKHYKCDQGKTYPQFKKQTLDKLLSAKGYFLKGAFQHFISKKPSRTSISPQKFQRKMEMQEE